MFGRKTQQAILAQLIEANAKPTEVELTESAYRRWLRAGRPQPVSWFLAVNELEQETLARWGDEHNSDLCLHMGEVIEQIAAQALEGVTRARKLAEPTAEVLSEEAEARRLAAGMIAKSMDSPVTFAGVTDRRAASELERQEELSASMSLMGRKPDPPAEDVAG